MKKKLIKLKKKKKRKKKEKVYGGSNESFNLIPK